MQTDLGFFFLTLFAVFILLKQIINLLDTQQGFIDSNEKTKQNMTELSIK